MLVCLSCCEELDADALHRDSSDPLWCPKKNRDIDVTGLEELLTLESIELHESEMCG